MSRAETILRAFGERVGLVPVAPAATPEVQTQPPVAPAAADTDQITDLVVPTFKGGAQSKIDPHIEAEIRRIEPEALRLGWSAARLWGTAFWPIETRGLAAVLAPTDRIVGIDSECISIARDDRRRTAWRFPNSETLLHFLKCDA
jgi:hypothetical protein